MTHTLFWTLLTAAVLVLVEVPLALVGRRQERAAGFPAVVSAASWSVVALGTATLGYICWVATWPS